MAAILSKESAGRHVRVAVNGGGCSGFQYAFDIASDRADDDLVIESDGATVLIDPVSLDFLKGARIDFVDDLIGQSFKMTTRTPRPRVVAERVFPFDSPLPEGEGGSEGVG